ncbi:MAG: PEGA domain-containing protein [Methanomicrobiales archaeon]|nr:PEGA domain-containing protein [Methanomicrobiales archaeon]
MTPNEEELDEMITASEGMAYREVYPATVPTTRSEGMAYREEAYPTSIGGGTGYFSISSSPSGSDVTFDGVFQGETPLVVSVYTTGTPRHTISVSRYGYKTWVQSYNQNPPPGGTISVNAVLQSDIQTGTISVTSSPSGAIARLDGGETLKTPGSFYSVSQGSHTVDISTSGYQPYTTSVRVSAGGTSSVSASLTPTQTYGSIRVTSSPSGAEVYVDEVYRGYTPLTVGSLSVGMHNVRLHLSGYQDYTVKANVPSGGQVVFSASLTKVYQPITGDVIVSSVPDGAAIYLDGTYRGITLKGNPFDISGVAPGSHVVMLQKPGYQDYSSTVSVTAGLAATVSASLTASPIPAQSGSITVQSDPSSADVYIDNQYKGITPVNVDNVAVGSHVVTLKMNGYTDGTYTVQVGAGQSVQVFGTLSPVSQTTQPTTAKSPFPVPFALCALSAVALLFMWRRKE